MTPENDAAMHDSFEESTVGLAVELADRTMGARAREGCRFESMCMRPSATGFRTTIRYTKEYSE